MMRGLGEGEPNRYSPLGATEVFDVYSAVVGDTFRVFIGHCGDDPRCTLFVTDGNGLFGLAVDTVRLMQIPGLVPPMTVVAVGYPTAGALRDTAQIRIRDLTPTRSPSFEHSGGGGRFLRFIAEELRPRLVERIPRALDDVTFFGHSLGGLFGTHVLLTQPDLFDRYILSSPSLWWDGGQVFGIEETRARSIADLRTSAFFGIGQHETDAGRRAEAINLPAGHPFRPPAAHLDMVDDLRRFVAQLSDRRYPSLEIVTAEIDDEYHATVPGIVLSRALRHTWAQRTEPSWP